MRTTNSISVPKLPLQVVFLAVLTFLFLSCSGESLPTEQNLSATVQESSAVAASKKAAPAPGNEPIAKIAEDNGFNELLKALFYVDEELETQLVDLFLNGTDQYTVFAPTDLAFQNLYSALGVTDITGIDPQLVRNVLLYHVVEGRRAANSVVPPKKERNIETLLGVDFKVDRTATIYAVGNTARITTANITASNGIIHIIDAVILPIE